METKLNTEKCNRVKRRLKCEGCFVVEPIGKRGGLALMWDNMINVEVLNYSQRHISAWITSEEGKMKWLLTGFYCEFDSSKREEAWNLLAALKPIGDFGWCVIGDFNEILTHDEKRGGSIRQERHEKF